MNMDEFEYVEQQVLHLTTAHRMLVELYGSKTTVSNMNAVSPLGFSLLQRTLHRDLVVSICAISDQPKVSGKHTATVLSLLDSLEEDDGPHAEGIKMLREQINSAVSILRKYRNKTIAHHDKNVALEDEKIQTPKVDDLDKAITELHDVMNKIRQIAGLGGCIYEWTSIGTAASAISWAIADSRRMKQLRELAKARMISPRAALELLKVRSDRKDKNIISMHAPQMLQANE